VATCGNTLGGAVDYWLGYRAKIAFAREKSSRWFHWLAKYGAKTMLLSWLPGIGDPLCTLAGWLHLPFWPSVFYMAIGKFARYVCMTVTLLYVPDGWWKSIGDSIGSSDSLVVPGIAGNDFPRKRDSLRYPPMPPTFEWREVGPRLRGDDGMNALKYPAPTQPACVRYSPHLLHKSPAAQRGASQ
jgi:hypothetical protein